MANKSCPVLESSSAGSKWNERQNNNRLTITSDRNSHRNNHSQGLGGTGLKDSRKVSSGLFSRGYGLMSRYVPVYCPYCKAKNIEQVETFDDVINACDICIKCGKLFHYDIEIRPLVKTFKEFP